MPTTRALTKGSLTGLATALVSWETSVVVNVRPWKRQRWLRKRMLLEEFPHHRARLEVRDAVRGPAPRSAAAVLGPAVAHSGDRAEHDFGALATTSVRHAPRRAHVVSL